MITKEILKKYIENFLFFDEKIEKLGQLLFNSYCLYESDFIDTVGKNLDLFLKSHFNDEGIELIIWWMFESVDKIIYNENKVINVASIDSFIDYIFNHKEFFNE